MSGIFPAAGDGGLPPNAADHNNPAHAFPPVLAPAGTTALYYGNGCDVRLRPEVINSLISEIAASVDRSELRYDPNANDHNLEKGIRYLIQRGLPVGSPAYVGPYDYVVTLDPPCTRYNDYLTLVLVPVITNLGAVRVNVNGLGLVPVLRNDGQPLQKNDWKVDRPLIVSCWHGVFYMVDLVDSQVLLNSTGARDYWVRTDGSDVTGDGSANSADKAFKTIRGAWNAAATRYAVSPIYPINIRLGIPGTYEPAGIGPYGGPVNLIGNVVDRSVYRVAPVLTTGSRIALVAVDVNLTVIGCTLTPGVGAAGSNGYCVVVQNGATVVLNNCQYELADDYTNSVFTMQAGASITLEGASAVVGLGGVRQAGTLFGCSAQSLMWGGTGGQSNTLSVQNLNFTSACVATDDLSLVRFTNLVITTGATTGSSYIITGNAVLNRAGQAIPGNGTGTLASGGQLI